MAKKKRRKSDCLSTIAFNMHIHPLQKLPQNNTPHHVLRPRVHFCDRQQLRFGIPSQNMCNDLGSLFWKQLALEGASTKGFGKSTQLKEKNNNVIFFHQVAVQLFVSIAQWLRATTCMTNRREGSPSNMVVDALHWYVEGACWAVAGLKPLTSNSALTTPTDQLPIFSMAQLGTLSNCHCLKPTTR